MDEVNALLPDPDPTEYLALTATYLDELITAGHCPIASLPIAQRLAQTRINGELFSAEDDALLLGLTAIEDF